MFFADIQIDDGDSLPVARPEGRIAGKPILTFLMSLLSECNEDRDDEASSEFAMLAPRAKQTLCVVCARLMGAVVNSEWGYCDGETYQSYVDRTGDRTFDEAEFEAGATHYMDAWTDIHTMIGWVQTVVIQLEIAPRTGESRLINDHILDDFRALRATLDMALTRGAKRARIDIH